MIGESERLFDDKTIKLLELLRDDDGKLLSQIIQDKDLKDIFDNDLDILIARLQMLAALHLVKFRTIKDEEDGDDVEITLTELGRNYLEAIAGS